MTFFLVAVALLFTQILLGRPTADNGRHAFFRSPSRQNRRPATNGLGKTFSKPFILAIPQEKAGITPKSATHGRLGKIQCENRLSWRFFKKKRRSRQSSRTAWEKSKRNPFIMAITLFSDGAHAKTGDRVLGKSNGKPFIMAIPQENAAITPKTATRSVWGNSKRKPFIMAIAKPSDPIGETFRTGEAIPDGPCGRSD